MKPSIFCVFVFQAVLLFFTSPLLAVSSNYRTQYFVSINGNDLNPGTIERPFATLERAREKIREIKAVHAFPIGGVTIQLRGGTYVLTKTFDLTDKDSGTEQSPIIYRSYKHEKVYLIGGREIKGFSSVTDPSVLQRIDKTAQGNILQVDLRAQGIADFGQLKSRGGMYERVLSAGLELFFQDKPMTLARWPNHDWARIKATPAGQHGGRFAYVGDRPKRWALADDIWLHGYWTWDWADLYVKVKSINTETHEMAIIEEQSDTFGFTPGNRYYALNILEELDEPGEWYLDRAKGILYFWPPAPINKGKAFVSVLNTIISMHDVSYVTFSGITIEYCRGTAVEVQGGSHDLIAGCTLRNTGSAAVRIEGGIESGVAGCDVYQCGEGGIVLHGGDRKTLNPAGNYAINNSIHDYSRWVRTYRPGITVSGVGNRLANNLIHSAPHIAIWLHGNEHIIEFNDIHHVCMETSDAGAFYMGRDYSERGNIVRYNYFHELGPGDVQAIYLDDLSSGTTVFGNVVYKASRGVLIGGGRDNVVQNNIFVKCGAAVHVDARGVGWTKKHIAVDGDWHMQDKLKEVNYNKPPYSIKYPKLTTVLEDDFALPKGNIIEHNISFESKWLEIDDVSKSLVTIQSNLVDLDPGFLSGRAAMNFQLKNDSTAYQMGFKRIPMERIGLYKP